MYFLDHIYLNGYKSIDHLDLRLNSLNILIGANGAGKTNFISLFTLCSHIFNGHMGVYVAKQGGANTFLHFGQQTTARLEIRLTFKVDGCYHCRLEPAPDDTLFFEKEEVRVQDKSKDPKPYVLSLGYGHKETRLFDEYGSPTTGTAGYIIQAMKRWQVYHFQDTSSSAKVKQTGDLNDNSSLRPDGGNLAAFLYRLGETNPQSYRHIVAAVRQVTPFFDNFSLGPDPLNLQKIRLEWVEKGSERYFSAHDLSDGTLRFICLATLLLQPDLPETIVIDEPELGLHPCAIVVLASLLRKASQKAQVIVSTQSVQLVKQFQPEDLIVVDREGGSSSFQRLDPIDLEAWLDEYDLGTLWEKNVFGGRPRF